MTQAKSKMLQKTRRSFLGAAIAATIMVLFLGQQHLGFMLYVPLLLLLPWWLYSIGVMIFVPERRFGQAVKAGVWFIAVLLILGIHFVRHELVRDHANNVVTTIKQYEVQHGNCPQRLEDAGIDSKALKKVLPHAGYSCADGKPFLFYAATFIIYDTYYYDFKSNTWVYRS